jgi:hypothetical protein
MIRRLLWDKAESDLGDVDPAVVVRLKNSAEQILHSIPPWVHPSDEGVSNGIMWHRAEVHEAPEEQPDGPQNYFIFYRNGSEQVFEILGVCSIYQIANRLASRMNTPSYSPYNKWNSA